MVAVSLIYSVFGVMHAHGFVVPSAGVRRSCLWGTTADTSANTEEDTSSRNGWNFQGCAGHVR